MGVELRIGRDAHSYERFAVYPAGTQKKEILELKDYELVNAFERAVTNVCIMTNHRARVSQQATKELEWIREELLQRLK